MPVCVLIFIQEPWLIDINSDSEEVELALNELAKRLSTCIEKAATYKSYQKSCKVFFFYFI